MTTILGPLADKLQFDRVMSFIDSGKNEAELIVGGHREGERGYFVQPTIFLNPKKEAKVYKQEIFGPVLTITTFDTEDEAIELANDTTYGLSSCIYSSDIARALRVAGKIEAGTVAINSAYLPDIQAPWGGFKQSGQGRECGKAGLDAYLQAKTIKINMNSPNPH
jgi:aldehyde dehydrogenase (NAD+)